MSFRDLPDYITIEQVALCFDEFFNKYDNCYYNIVEILEELEELADRQWNTHELLSDSLKNKVENYLYKIIDLDHYPIMDSILVIIIRLGLGNIYSWIIENKNTIKNIEVIKEIKEIEETYGDSYVDPYAHYWG